MGRFSNLVIYWAIDGWWIKKTYAINGLVGSVSEFDFELDKTLS